MECEGSPQGALWQAAGIFVYAWIPMPDGGDGSSNSGWQIKVNTNAGSSAQKQRKDPAVV
jgi:hypothetical protein